ncbi:MAG: glycosyltransferase, partial [Gammaproteobacteria bacterium]|nr:glycosyltransferase [Gammaproteobacteria bacterium]
LNLIHISNPLEKNKYLKNSSASKKNEADLAPAHCPAPDDTVQLLYVSAYYPHKNIEFIPAVAEALRQQDPERRFEFVVTLPDDEPGLQRLLHDAEARGVGDCIRNAGRVNLRELIELYRGAHICYMPSLLETFSATYPEAMALGRPIVTNDLDFARANCGTAAVYATANDPSAHARAILGLLNDSSEWDACVRRGKARLAELPDARGKYELYVQAIRATVAEM